MFTDLVKRIYDEKVKAGDVDAPTWKATTEEYWKAVKEGWNKVPKYFSPEQIAMLEIRRNVNTFAAFKNHANIIELTQALNGPDGKPVSFSEFKNKAKAIDEKYNEKWLQAEYNLALNSAKSAAQWYAFKEKGGKLEYKTIGDGRVRDEHRKLDGTILPVDHPFWEIYYPPNGWNCRCFVRWRPDSTQEKAPEQVPDVIEMFRNNVGVTSQVFTNDHPFISEIGRNQSEMIRALSEKETLRWERKFVEELAKESLMAKTTKLDIDGFKGDVQYSSRRLKEAINQPHYSQLEKNRAILNIEQLMKEARFVKTLPNIKEVKTQIKQYHYLLTTVANQVSYILLEETVEGEIYFFSIVDHLR